MYFLLTFQSNSSFIFYKVILSIACFFILCPKTMSINTTISLFIKLNCISAASEDDYYEDEDDEPAPTEEVGVMQLLRQHHDDGDEDDPERYFGAGG